MARMSKLTAPISIQQVRSSVKGEVIGPDDAAYDEARRSFIGGIDRRPAVIVKVADPDDVRTVIALARSTGLPLAVRSGGHSAASHSVVDDGIVLDVSAMKAIEIDVAGRTAWAESGLTAAEYSAAVGAHGLATGFGDTGSVGLGGITLGGGVGLPRPQVRPDDRRPARRRGRDRGRPAPRCRCRSPPRPLLGDPWRWRQLRGRDPVQVPAARRELVHRRHADPAGDVRDRRRVHHGGRGGARRAVDDRQRDALPADAVRARGAPRTAREHGPDGVRG